MPHKDPEKARAYRQAYRKKNADKIKSYMKSYSVANAERIKLYLREYRKEYDKENSARIKQKHKEWKEKIRELQTAIKMHYGCLNPNCKWKGSYDACCLDFHHINAKEKKRDLAKCRVCIATAVCEINKCTVLCANCHRLVTAGKLKNAFKKCCVDPEGKPI